MLVTSRNSYCTLSHSGEHTHLVGVDELLAQSELALEQSPVHLDVPGEGVRGTHYVGYHPQSKGDVVASFSCVN